MTDEILTLPEVAQLLNVAEKAVYAMAQKGELPAFKVSWAVAVQARRHRCVD